MCVSGPARRKRVLIEVLCKSVPSHRFSGLFDLDGEVVSNARFCEQGLVYP